MKWWHQPKTKVYLEVTKVVNYLVSNQQYRKANYLRAMRLYGNFENTYSNYFILSNNSASNSMLGKQPQVKYNVVASCIDTLSSKFDKLEILPTFLTEDGDWFQQKQAQQMNKFIQGAFYGGGFEAAKQKAIRNAMIFGDGFIKVIPDDGKVTFENIFPYEVFVDELDGYYQAPRSIYHSKVVDREVAIAQFPEYKQQLQTAAPVKINAGLQQNSDLIELVEAWHLPSNKDAKDGRHVIICDNCDLLDEEYTWDIFPFVQFRWKEMPIGFWSQSVIDDLIGIQYEINRLLYHIQESQRLLSSPKIIVNNAGSVVTEHINNEIGSIIKVSGPNAPQVYAPAVIAADIFQQLENLYRKAYEIVGISQLSAGSKKPSGLDSGVALREFADIETERFISQGKRAERFVVDCAGLAIKTMQKMYESGDKIVVTSYNKKNGMSKIKWKDLNYKEDMYVMQCFPTSALPSKPQAKLQSVQEMIQAGFITSDYAMELLDFPDLEAYSRKKNAMIRAVEMFLEDIVENNVYRPPYPTFNFQVAGKIAQEYFNTALVNKVPDDRLEKINMFIEACRELEIKSQPPPPPQMMPQIPQQGVAPQGVI